MRETGPRQFRRKEGRVESHAGFEYRQAVTSSAVGFDEAWKAKLQMENAFSYSRSAQLNDTFPLTAQSHHVDPNEPFRASLRIDKCA